MATVALTGQTFEQIVTSHEIVLVDFWASWCGPCRQFAPIYEQASATHPDIVFAKVDTDAEQELAAAAEITSIPTIMAFRDGICVFAQPGALPAQALQQVIDGVRGLDMDDIRRQIDEAHDHDGHDHGHDHDHDHDHDGHHHHGHDEDEDHDERVHAHAQAGVSGHSGRSGRSGTEGVDYPDANGAIV
jgi:thioredoxin